MSWVVVLIIALAGLALVVAGLAYVGLKAWRLAKRGMSVSRGVAPLADHLSRQAMVLSANAERLAANSEELGASITRLQASIARLQVVADALADAVEPYLLLTGWLSGERSWNDWQRWSRGNR